MSEAFACLKTQDGVDRTAILNIDGETITAEESDKLPTDPAMVSMMEICREVATDQTATALKDSNIANILMSYTGKLSCPAKFGAMLESAFSSGFAYGIRIGQEMERGEFTSSESLPCGERL